MQFHKRFKRHIFGGNSMGKSNFNLKALFYTVPTQSAVCYMIKTYGFYPKKTIHHCLKQPHQAYDKNVMKEQQILNLLLHF